MSKTVVTSCRHSMHDCLKSLPLLDKNLMLLRQPVYPLSIKVNKKSDYVFHLTKMSR